jgi:hypothetical protein
MALRSIKHRPTQLIKPNTALQWIQVAKGAPYFVTEGGEDWTPIGQNDAITWPELQGCSGGKTSPLRKPTCKCWPHMALPACG